MQVFKTKYFGNQSNNLNRKIYWQKHLIKDKANYSLCIKILWNIFGKLIYLIRLILELITFMKRYFSMEKMQFGGKFNSVKMPKVIIGGDCII